jgi:hypothetical protein
MIFTSGEKRYRISFGHQVFEGKGKMLETVRGECQVRAESKCFLVELTSEKDAVLLATGVAYCYVPDHFNKNEGRVRAMRSALRQAWPGNSHRFMWALAFTAYSNRNRTHKKAA